MTKSAHPAGSEHSFKIGPIGDWLPLVCPETRLLLERRDAKLIARNADGEIVREWEFENGIPNLVLGSRFEDATDEACRCYEVQSNEYSTRHYWIPLFSRMFREQLERGEKPRLLSTGCGIGTEVDLLCDAGFACYGVDNGNRSQDWPKRRHQGGLVLANAMHLPFADGSFDAVFCGCVFPHVGVVGDTNVTSERYLEDRQRLATEMVRVLRGGGSIVACSPNRLCPLDIFHGRKPGSYLPRLNPPTSGFLLSAGDYFRMFTRAGCSNVYSLPVDGFWGFVTMKKSLKGRLLAAPIQASFHLASLDSLRFLRHTPFVPWVAAQGVK